MLFTITFLAINEKKTNPNGQCYGDYRIDKVYHFHSSDRLNKAEINTAVMIYLAILKTNRPISPFS